MKRVFLGLALAALAALGVYVIVLFAKVGSGESRPERQGAEVVGSESSDSRRTLQPASGSLDEDSHGDCGVNSQQASGEEVLQFRLVGVDHQCVEGEVVLEAPVFPRPWSGPEHLPCGALLFRIESYALRELDLTVKWHAPGYIGGWAKLSDLMIDEQTEREEYLLPVRATARAVCIARVVNARSSNPLESAEVYTKAAYRNSSPPLAVSDSTGHLEFSPSDEKLYVLRTGFLPTQIAHADVSRDLGVVALQPDVWLSRLTVDVASGDEGAPWGGRLVVHQVSHAGDLSKEIQAGLRAASELLRARSRQHSGPRWATSLPHLELFVEPGDYVVSAWHPVEGQCVKTVSLAGQDTALRLELREGATVRLNGSQPVTETFYLRSVRGDRLEHRFHSGDGSLSYVPPGEYRIERRLANGVSVFGDSFLVPNAPETVDVQVPGLPKPHATATVSGRVLRRVSGADEPLPGVRVQVAGAPGWEETDSAGYFVIEGLTPGRYALRVKGHFPVPGGQWRFEIRSSDVESGQTIELADVVVR